MPEEPTGETKPILDVPPPDSTTVDASESAAAETTSSTDPSAASPTSAIASRRRIAFVLRERPVLHPQKSEPEPAPVVVAPPSPTPPEPPKPVRRSWSVEEVSAFYEGIKIYGKDFDSVVKFMAKRKILKRIEYVKQFFFNSVKSYRQLLALTDDDFANIPRDARELFLLINACEWKRKTLSMKIVIEKFRELIYEGVVTLKAGRRYVTIKTPPCPALCRYFSVKKGDKIPNDLYVHLEPTSNGDHVFMRNRDQNPYLRVKLNTNDRVMKLLDFLHRKWAAVGDQSPISVTLWPDAQCEIASLSVHHVESSPFISLSMNKLIRNVEEQREKAEKKEGQTTGIKMGTDVNTKTKPTYTVIYPKPFNLTDRVISEGITFQNIRNSTVAELFLVCGRKSPIKLRYQVECENVESRSQEPWKSLINLLDQGYGEWIAPPKKLPVKKQAEDGFREGPSTKKKKETAPKPAIQEAPGDPVSSIVRQENDDFESQLALLKKTSRQKYPSKRKIVSLDTRTPQLSNHAPVTLEDSAETLSRQIFAAPKCTLIPKRGNNFAEGQLKQANPKKAKVAESAPPARAVPSTSKPKKNMPIDFSSVVISPVKKQLDSEMLRLKREEFLSSLKTPVGTPKQTPQKSLFQQFFGDELSMSPNSTRHASQLDQTIGAANGSVDFTDMMYAQLRDQGGNESIMSNPDLDISVTEVQRHYHDMLESSQNSHDYVLDQFNAKKKKK